MSLKREPGAEQAPTKALLLGPSVGISQNFWEIKGCNHLLGKRALDSALPHMPLQESFLRMLAKVNSLFLPLSFIEDRVASRTKPQTSS